MPFFTSFTGKILSAPGLKLGPQIFQFVKTISSNIQGYNLRNDLLANGWDGVIPVDAQITVNSGVYVWSDNISIAAFTTGSLVADSVISIVNNGYIIGRGGNGGNSNPVDTFGVTPPAAQAGGSAINLNYPVSITNNSYIAGGGGGGRGGYSAGGGGAGGGTGGTAFAGTQSQTGGAGGAPGSAGSNGSNITGGSYDRKGSGGGGGRIIPGTGGAGGENTAASMYGRGGQEGGGGGGGIGDDDDWSFGGGGGGRAGGGTGGSGITGVTGRDGTTTSGGRGWGDPYYNGGGGGGPWGGSGGASDSNANSFAGAAGGKCVNLNGNSVTWVATGTRYGAIS